MLSVFLIIHLSCFLIFISWMMFHTLIFDSFYNKELTQYFTSFGGEFVIAYWSMPVPESYFHLLRLFLRYIYHKLELMCSYIDTEWLLTRYLLSMFFVNQYETQMFIYFWCYLIERGLFYVSCVAIRFIIKNLPSILHHLVGSL